MIRPDKSRATRREESERMSKKRKLTEDQDQKLTQYNKKQQLLLTQTLMFFSENLFNPSEIEGISADKLHHSPIFLDYFLVS